MMVIDALSNFTEMELLKLQNQEYHPEYLLKGKEYELSPERNRRDPRSILISYLQTAY